MISIITITEQLNSLKRESSELTYLEFRSKVHDIISYKELPKLLIEERIVFKLGNNIVFAKGLIHRNQISPIIEHLRELSSNRVNKHLKKKKSIEEAISLLVSNGYKVVKV